MRIHIGCEMSFDFPQETPLIAMLNVHYSRTSDLERPDFLISNPPVPIESYRDSFGNWCNRLVAPPGRFTFGTDAVIRD
ncbi:transglutaminase family protein, partial [Mesorhizobium sp. M7A.F.Ca.CA.001.11.2.1]